MASGADAAGNLAWRELAGTWLRGTGWAAANPRTDFIALGRGVLPLICGDVIRPSLPWLLTPETPKNLAAEMARSRDPGGFAALAALARTDPASASTKDLAVRRIAAILAAKGGTIAGITVGDCLELLDVAWPLAAATPARTSTSCCTRWRIFPPAAPPTVRAFKTPGQLSMEQLVDRYPDRLPAGPRPDHRLPAGTPAGGRPRDAAEPVPRPGRPVLARPGTPSSRDRLAAAGARARPRRGSSGSPSRRSGPRARPGRSPRRCVPRHDGMNTLAMVRAFYLDIAQWAVDDPARWGPWAVPCPIRDEEMSREEGTRRTASPGWTSGPGNGCPSCRSWSAAVERRPEQDRRDPGRRAGHRTGTAVHRRRADAAPAGDDQARHQREGVGRGSRPPAGAATSPSKRTGRSGPGRPWRFFASTGIRIEELAELSHHSFVQYRLPGYRRAGPAAADRPVQDRYRAAATY